MTPRPRIGLDLDHDHDGRRWVFKSPEAYARAIVEDGGLPVPILPDDPRPPERILDDLDGLLMSGGDDVHPRLVGREPTGLPMTLLSVRRERFVLALAAAALRAELPVLGVCLGCQALNLAAGGDIWIDLTAEVPGALDHRGGRIHAIRPEPKGFLARWWRESEHALASHHHQAVRRLGRGLALEARAPDGIIEAFRAEGHPFLLGCQWHPELQPPGSPGRAPITRLVAAARDRRARKN